MNHTHTHAAPSATQSSAQVRAPNGDCVAQLEHVSFGYRGEPVLRDVSLAIHRGDFLAIPGPNGGGKSTLLKLMLGLLAPQSGSIALFGGPPAAAIRRVGYVPQAFDGERSFPMTVLDATLMGLVTGRTFGWRFGRRQRELGDEALERVGMLRARGRPMSSLSGGQRQRVLIARALVSRPELLLLDEPTASVDAEGRGQLHEVLSNLNREVTVVMVSHDVSVIWGSVNSVACVNRTLYHHPRAEITDDMVRMMYSGDDASCPVELIAHGLPHRVLQSHPDSP
jgi:zinc transport system ATP-binding protein